jgi:hypothetical protein
MTFAADHHFISFRMSNKEFHHHFRRRPRLAFHSLSFRDCSHCWKLASVVAFLFVWLWMTASLHTSLLVVQPNIQPLLRAGFVPAVDQQRPHILERTQNHAVPLSPLLWSPQHPSEQVVKRDKQGKVVHRSITELKADPSASFTNSSNNSNSSSSSQHHQFHNLQDAARGREPLLELLHDAGVTTLEADAVAQLPPWSDIAAMYYTDAVTGEDQSDAGPVIVGLDTCAKFRQSIMAHHHEDASIGVAGLFNTGTNPLAMYLSANCRMPLPRNDNNK